MFQVKPIQTPCVNRQNLVYSEYLVTEPRKCSKQISSREGYLKAESERNVAELLTNIRSPSPVMTHKYRGSIVVLSISKSVKPNEEQKVLTSGFQQGFTASTKREMFLDF